MRSMANRLIEMWFSLSHYCHLWSIFFMKAIFSYVFPLCLGSKKHACYILISVIRNIESWSMAHNSHVNFLVEISFVAHYSLPIFTWHQNFLHFFFFLWQDYKFSWQKYQVFQLVLSLLIVSTMKEVLTSRHPLRT